MTSLARAAVADDDDLIAIIDDAAPEADGADRWKVAIIDDDVAVHDGTRFALAGFRLHGRGLEFVSAASAAEGRALLRAHPDVAVILLDVVMESDVAGLELVDYVRRELGNDTVRIVLRTGQPGHAPEHRIVVDYDINDYKAKTELTAEKLFTTMTAALRSFEQLRHLTRMRTGLEEIVASATDLHRARTVAELAGVALGHLSALAGGTGSGLVVCDVEATGEPAPVAGIGRWTAPDLPCPGTPLADAIDDALARRGTALLPDAWVGCIPAGSRTAVIAIELAAPPSDADLALLGVYCARLSAAFENVALYEALEDANALLEQKVVERSAELSAANARLEAQADELRRANALKNELLGIVAHDLKNPLMVIMGRAEILAEQLDAPVPDLAVAATQLAAIRDSARHLGRVIATRIAEAQQEAPAVAIRPRRIDLAALVRKVAAANAAYAARKGQTLAVEADGPVEADADEDRLAEAIDNLVGNAVKYSPIGGAVRVQLRAGGDEAVLSVSDSGPGIADADRGRLFQPFQRLSASPTGGESATGLGLYGAKRIVDLHRGRLCAAPAAPGEGATFVLALPLP